jgi:hypothetical protein
VPLFRDDHPRTQHYRFAHRELLAAARRLAARMPDLARSGRLNDTLARTWDRAGQAVPTAERLPREGLAASLHSVQNREIVLVTMPKAEHAAEAHFVAIVLSDGRLADYYVLEHGWTVRDEPRTVICKWDERGHANLGNGPPADPDAFLDAVEKLVASAS